MKEIYCPRVVTSLVLCFLQKLTAPAVRHFLPLLCGTGSALAPGAEHPHSATRCFWCLPGLLSVVSTLGAEFIDSCKNRQSSLPMFLLVFPVFSWCRRRFLVVFNLPPPGLK